MNEEASVTISDLIKDQPLQPGNITKTGFSGSAHQRMPINTASFLEQRLTEINYLKVPIKPHNRCLTNLCVEVSGVTAKICFYFLTL